MHALAKGFQAEGYNVHVVCPLPNYPTGKVFFQFKKKLYAQSKEEDIITHRLWLWPSNSGNKLVRLLSMLSFSVSLSLFFILKKIPKKVVVQYSPVFVGFTAVFFRLDFQKKDNS